MKMINIYVFLLAKCDYPRHPNNQRRIFLVKNGPLVNGRYREGSKIYFKCELGIGNKIMYHPMVCQANGEWTQFRCEGNIFTDLSSESAYPMGLLY